LRAATDASSGIRRWWHIASHPGGPRDANGWTSSRRDPDTGRVASDVPGFR
jgi:hypothetical protein